METTGFSTARTTPSLHLRPMAVLLLLGLVLGEGRHGFLVLVFYEGGGAWGSADRTRRREWQLPTPHAPAVVDRLLRIVGLEDLAVRRIGGRRQVVLLCFLRGARTRFERATLVSFWVGKRTTKRTPAKRGQARTHARADARHGGRSGGRGGPAGVVEDLRALRACAYDARASALKLLLM